jgi:hypothetical protein
MTTLKTLNIKIVANELSFPLVTDMVSFDARFDSYECSKTVHGAEFSGQTGHRSEISSLKGKDE